MAVGVLAALAGETVAAVMAVVATQQKAVVTNDGAAVAVAI